MPLTALAPMQDVTTLPFMRIIAGFGSPSFYVTEYFRVHEHSTLEPLILASITQNESGRPVYAQLIGEDLRHLERTVHLLAPYPIAGIDLNMGCPAPKVYKKNVGGGLLREPARVDAILGCLRAAITGRFTVKMRVGFADWAVFPEILDLINHHRVDLLTVHGRTVKEMYRGEPHYDLIEQAVAKAHCPVLANGNISSVRKGLSVLEQTGAAGLMVGRAAIRNPWIFRQFEQAFSGQPVFQPTLGDVYAYIEALFYQSRQAGTPENRHVAYMKKFLNFIGQGVDPEGRFLKSVRRTQTAGEFFAVCAEHLLTEGKAEEPFADEPYAGVLARPNHESNRGMTQCSELMTG